MITMTTRRLLSPSKNYYCKYFEILIIFVYVYCLSNTRNILVHAQDQDDSDDSSSASLAASQQCVLDCTEKYHTNTQQHFSDFSAIDKLHGLTLRNVLRHSRAEELQKFCEYSFKPFMTCMYNCPKSSGRDLGISDYNSLAHVCIDHLDVFVSKLDCLLQAEQDTRSTCRKERSKHAVSLNKVNQYLNHQSDQSLNNIGGVFNDFCDSLEKFLKCERPIEEAKCGSEAIVYEQELHFLTLGLVKTHLKVEHQDDALPESCQYAYDDFETHKVATGHEVAIHRPTDTAQAPPPPSPSFDPQSSQSSSECVRTCVENLHNHTIHAKLNRFTLMDDMHGTELRKFLRASYTEELKAYCKNSFQPFTICLTKCPKTIGRDLTLTDYIALTHICIDHLDDFTSNLQCLRKAGAEATDTCAEAAEQHEHAYIKLDQAIHHDFLPADQVADILTDYCPRLEKLIQCETPTISEECGAMISQLEHDILVTEIATARQRLDGSAHQLPKSCGVLYESLTSASGDSMLRIYSLWKHANSFAIVLLTTFILCNL